MELNAHKWVIKQKLKQFVQKCKQALWFLTRDNPRRRQFVASPLRVQWIVFTRRSGIAAAWNGSIHPASSGPKVSPRVFEFAALLLLLSILLHCWRRRLLLLLVTVADVICQTRRSDASDANTSSAGTRTSPMLIAPISVDRWVVQRVHWLSSCLNFYFIHLRFNNFLKIFDLFLKKFAKLCDTSNYCPPASFLGPMSPSTTLHTQYSTSLLLQYRGKEEEQI